MIGKRLGCYKRIYTQRCSASIHLRGLEARVVLAYGTTSEPDA